jgi:uncharacterized membrane protein
MVPKVLTCPNGGVTAEMPGYAAWVRGGSGSGRSAAALRWAGGGIAASTLIVSVLGLAGAAYLTVEHFTQNSYAGCPASATFNCARVTTSAQSHIAGIPVAVLGLAFFVFMVAVNSPWGWRAQWSAVHVARLASVVAGMIFVIYLIYAELILIGSVCLYCTGVHIATFLLFGLVVTKAATSGMRPAAGGRRPGTAPASRPKPRAGRSALRAERAR